MDCDFSLKHYEFILIELLNCGFRFKSFFNVDINQSMQVTLRHDIDFGLSYENALEIAEIENKLGIKSTWFVMLRSPFYNLFTPDEQRITYSLISDGHDIGLHFDGANYLSAIQYEIEKAIINEKEMLEVQIKSKVQSFSFHRPASSSIKAYKVLPSSIINTYDKKFTSGLFTYASDSRRNWRDGCICERISTGTIQNLQLVIHPFWWNNPCLTIKDRFNLFYDQIITNHDKTLDSNIKDWKDEKKGTKFNHQSF